MTKADSVKTRFVPIRLKLLSATIVSGFLALLIATAGLYCMHLLNQSVLDGDDEQHLNNFVSQLSKWKENHALVRKYSGLDSQREARELSLGKGEVAFNQFEPSINQDEASIESQSELSASSSGLPVNDDVKHAHLVIRSLAKSRVANRVFRVTSAICVATGRKQQASGKFRAHARA